MHGWRKHDLTGITLPELHMIEANGEALLLPNVQNIHEEDWVCKLESESLTCAESPQKHFKMKTKYEYYIWKKYIFQLSNEIW